MGYCYFNEDGEILYNSETFGMTFWIDNNNDFCYCPTFNNNEPDKDNWGYVCEWDEITSTDLDKLFVIHPSHKHCKNMKYKRHSACQKPV